MEHRGESITLVENQQAKYGIMVDWANDQDRNEKDKDKDKDEDKDKE